MLIETVIAMAYRGYLSQPSTGQNAATVTTTTSGIFFVEFILRQCALSDTSDAQTKGRSSANTSDANTEYSNEQLRSSAEAGFTLFSTTIKPMHDVLWPTLFAHLTRAEYANSASIMCKSLTHIAEQKRAANVDAYRVHFETNHGLPNAYEVFARLVALVGVPLVGGGGSSNSNNKNRGAYALQLMRHVAPSVHPLFAAVWESELPKLAELLDDEMASATFCEKRWQELILKLLLKTLDELEPRNQEEILSDVARAFGKHIETLYSTFKSEDEKVFA